MLVPSSYARILVLKEALKSHVIPDVLVDAGCGNGLPLLQADAVRKIGLDLIPPKLVENIECIKCDVNAIPLNDEICDCLMSLDVIEHIREDGRVISEFYRVLRRNGTLILTTPNVSQFMPYKVLRILFGLDTAKMHKLWQHAKPGYRKDEVIALVEGQGFKVICIHSFCQPLTRVLEIPYIILLRISEYIYSPAKRGNKLRKTRGRIIGTLERTHDLLFSLLLAPITRIIEKSANDGFLYLIMCKKDAG